MPHGIHASGNRTSLAIALALLAGCLSTSAGSGGSGPEAAEGEEWVTVFPAHAYRQGDEWRIPLTYRVHEDRSWLGRVVSRVTESIGDLEPEEVRRLRDRLHPFASDSESLETVTFVVDEDPERERHQVKGPDGEPVRTGLNGFARGTLSLEAERVREIRESGKAGEGWITLTAVSPEHRGSGPVQLVEDEGLSVISDIDDTVKRTGIPGGARAVVRTTFLEEWEAVPEMVDRFHQWKAEAGGSAAFHYVSAGPWQLQGPLAKFLHAPEPGFPRGSYHMRPLRKHPLSLRTWRDLHGLVLGEEDTYEYKVEATARIVERFPDREFILVGDTSQDDPEAYREVRERYPDRVREIVIRDVTDARSRAPERLEGMTVLPAEDLTAPHETSTSPRTPIQGGR